MSTVLDFDTDTTDETEEGPVTHIIRAGPGEDPYKLIMEARISGTPLTALCGHVWVPDKDPRKYPVCQPCKDVHELFWMTSDDVTKFPEAP